MKSIYLKDKKYDDFRQETLKFIEDKFEPFVASWEKNRIFPDHLTKDFFYQGLIGLSQDRSILGQGKDFWHEIIFTECLARARTFGYMAVISVHTNMSIPLLAKYANEDQKQQFLIPAMKGDNLLALAMTEPDAGSDINSITTTAKKEGDYYIINGHKKYIGVGSVANTILLVCKTSNRDDVLSQSIIIVPANTQGVVQKKLNTIGLNTGDFGEITFENVKVTASNLLGKQGFGYKYFNETVQRERIIASVGVLAVTLEVIDETINFTKNRYRFGDKVINKQVIKHRLVDHISEIETLRHFCYDVIEKYIEGYNVDKEILMAKIKSSEAAQRIIKDCLQMHGAESLIADNWIVHAYKDASTYTILGGPTEVVKDMLAKLLKI